MIYERKNLRKNMDNEKGNNKYPPEVPEKYRIEYFSRPTGRQKREKQKSYKLRHWRSLKLWWRWKGKRFVYTSLFVIGIIFVIWYADTWYTERDYTTQTKKFPPLEEPKTVTFQWEYGGLPYTVEETLYKTAYDYYNSSPDKHCWQEGGDYESCLKGFLEEAEEDNTISKIASDIKAIASKNGLRGDELLELTVAFVQSIPYDEDKLELIIYPNNLEDLYPRYPYEVLYDNKGVCSGKTFLAASLIKELGYGVALFDYEAVTEDEIGHIAPAVECPKEYSSYNSDYCFAEVTDLGFRIGEIPQMDIRAGKPKTRTTIELFNEEKESELTWSELKNAEVYEITEGNSYHEIIKTAQTIQRIETLEKELNKLEGIISLLGSEANQLENSVNYYDQQAKAVYRRHEILRDYALYNEYRRLYSQYESTYNKYESKANEHDREVDKYNNLADEYNALIGNFYK